MTETLPAAYLSFGLPHSPNPYDPPPHLAEAEPIMHAYQPSKQAARFHASESRFRMLCWGVKGGKTVSGAVEFLDRCWALNPRIAWVVAPTKENYEESLSEIKDLLGFGTDLGEQLVSDWILYRGRIKLATGTEIVFRTGDVPANLRGPNVGVLWIDEAGYLKDESWYVLRSRVSATMAPVIMTTSPEHRNWFWRQCQRAGMPFKPGKEVYGEYESKDGHRWLSNWPTSSFPWVSDEEVIDACKDMPEGRAQRDYGAKFATSDTAAFSADSIDSAIDRMPRVRKDKKFVIGADLGKSQDFTVLVVMDGRGWVYKVDRWNKIHWETTQKRIAAMAEKWNAAVVLDTSNAGDVVQEALRSMGVNVHPFAMNSPMMKIQLIEALQMALDYHNIKIPHDLSKWSSKASMILLEELRNYQVLLTSKGHVSYSAPREAHDDCVIALALANWGRRLGLAGGGMTAIDIAMGRDEYIKKDRESRMMRPRAPRLRRPRTFSRVFGRGGGGLWQQGGGGLWRR